MLEPPVSPNLTYEEALPRFQDLKEFLQLESEVHRRGAWEKFVTRQREREAEAGRKTSSRRGGGKHSSPATPSQMDLDTSPVHSATVGRKREHRELSHDSRDDGSSSKRRSRHQLRLDRRHSDRREPGKKSEEPPRSGYIRAPDEELEEGEI